jgi:hypothetical protein
MNAIGFYWTLPVPWAGFTRFDCAYIDRAAYQSRTIALQREAFHAWAAAGDHLLIHERAFIELAPDRGSAYIREPLADLVRLADTRQATVVYVDFGESLQQRSHQLLRHFVGEHAAAFMPIALTDELETKFRTHFDDWRGADRRWRANKPVRCKVAQARAETFLAQGKSRTAIAQELNRAGILSPTGKPWTGDNLRKFLKLNATSSPPAR